MKAAVLYGREDVRVEHIEPQALRKGEVRVAIGAALTCGTDLKVFKRGYHARMIVPPAVFGHEFAGAISEIGPGVSDWRKGDRVVVANSAPCGACFYCRNNQENLCDDLLFLNGAYAESIIVPARLAQKNMLRLRPKTPFADAALTEPLACAAQGWQELSPRAGQHVLILGSGPIGLMFAALARHGKCHTTLAGRGARLRTARALGTEHIIDIGDGHDLAETVKKSSRCEFDLVIEAVGKPEAWQAATRLARKGGKINLFGGCPAGTTVAIDTNLLHYSNLTLFSSFHHTPRAIRAALELIEKGVVRARDFVDGEAFLDDLPALFRSMAAGNRAVKTLIRSNA
ncbi:MAG: zinc-dependent alcohol dehydrogenase [Limisphaerales bacterium]